MYCFAPCRRARMPMPTTSPGPISTIVLPERPPGTLFWKKSHWREANFSTSALKSLTSRPVVRDMRFRRWLRMKGMDMAKFFARSRATSSGREGIWLYLPQGVGRVKRTGEAVRRLILRIVDSSRNGERLHLRRRIRPQQRQHLLGLPLLRIQPLPVLILPHDRGHAVVDLLHQLVRRRRDDRARRHDRSARIVPLLPQPRKRERPPVLHPDVHRGLRLPIPVELPLVKPIHRDQAPPPLQRRPKRRLLRQRFRPRIDHSVPDRRVLRPRRDQ